MNSHVCFADAWIVAIPPLEVGWKRWHAALCNPRIVCGTQLHWTHTRETVWRYGSLCEAGAIARFRGCLARTQTGGTFVHVNSIQIIKCAPSPPCIERLLIEASATGQVDDNQQQQPKKKKRRSPLMSLEEAMLALHCTRVDVFDRLMQYVIDCSVAGKSADAESPKLSRRKRKKQRREKLEAAAAAAAAAADGDAVDCQPEKKKIRMATAKKQMSEVARAKRAKRRALAAWTKYLRGMDPRRRRLRASRVNNAEWNALATVEAMPCSTTYAVREFPYELPSVEAIEHEIACGALDPHKNLPKDADWKRLRYIEQKKQPQVQWMCVRILALLEEMRRRSARNGSGDVCTRHIVDVGGGRGDLALAVAAAVPDDCVVCVVDTNAESLHAGRERAKQEHLSHKMKFICDRIENIYRTLHCDLVIGLHACGGLSEFALRLAIEQQASFLVCTCCFNSNPFLAVLTRPECCAEESDAVASMCPDPAITKNLVPPLPVVKAISAIAERKATESPETYHRGMHAINALRLSVVAALYESMRGPQRTSTIELCQTQFDMHWSGANCVVVGLVEHHKR